MARSLTGLGAALAVTAVLAAPPAAAGGYRHGYYSHHHGYPAYRGGRHVGIRYGYGRHHGHGHHHGGVSFSWYGPLYVTPRPRHVTTVAPPPPVESASRVRRALPDMPDFRYLALRGQDASQLTLDRRRCERDAWRATRPDPSSGRVEVERRTRYVAVRGDPGTPLPAAASGAILGAVGGAIGGDAGLGAAIGAAVGATSWLLGSAAAPTVSVPQEVVHRRYVPPPGPRPEALRAALMACMEDRGYEVR